MPKWKYDELDDDYESYEKHGRSRKKRSQTKAEELSSAYQFELHPEQWDDFNEKDFFRARVVEVHKRYCFVSPEPRRGEIVTNDVWLVTIAKRYLTSKRQQRNFVCVGDRVLCRKIPTKGAEVDTDLPQGVVEHMAKRESRIARLDPHAGMREHVLASNIDHLLIVASFKSPKIKWGLIDRYLVLAEMEKIHPIIVLNKTDLLENDDHGGHEFKSDALAKVSIYEELGYDVLQMQADHPDVEESSEFKKLLQFFDHSVSMVSGHSGVGKSSLVNLFSPEIEQDVEENSDIFYKGRHTTSFSSFLKLGTGGYLIDTPGIRSFKIEEHSAIDLTHCFRELRPFIGLCKYRGCRHDEESDCAIKEAVSNGHITGWRYRSYLAILNGASGREGRTREIEID